MEQLEEYKKDQREKVNELLLKASVRKETFFKHQRTTRQFLVEVYEENTEFLACMQMLGEISKWFTVKPL